MKGVEIDKKENKNGGIALLVVVIIILLSLVILLATGTISLKNNAGNNNQNSNDNTNTTNVSTNNTSSVVGIYTAKFDSIKDDSGEAATAVLTLYGNGIFTYEFKLYAPGGVLGNYTIEGNKINLTNWFNTGSGTGLVVTNGTKTLIINNDGSITDSNIKNSIMISHNITTAKLVRSNDIQEMLDLSNMLYFAFLNDNDKISEPLM